MRIRNGLASFLCVMIKLSYFSFSFLLMPLLVSFFWKAAAFFLLFRMLFGTLTVTLEAVFLKALDLIVFTEVPLKVTFLSFWHP